MNQMLCITLVVGNFLTDIGSSLTEAFDTLLKNACNSVYGFFLKALDFLDISKALGWAGEVDLLNPSKPGGAIYAGALQVTMAFGAALAVVLFAASIADKVSNDQQMALEMFIPPFARLLGSLILCFYAERIINFAAKFGEIFNRMIVGSKAAESGKIGETLPLFAVQGQPGIVAESINIGVGTTLAMVIGLLILFIILLLFGLILTVCAAFVVVSRSIEFGVRSLGFPIATAAYAEEGFRGGAGKYFKKLIACALRLGIITLIIQVYQAISIEKITNVSIDIATVVSDTIGNLGLVATAVDVAFAPHILLGMISAIIPLLVYGIATIALLFKSGQLVDDMLGA